MRSIGRVQFDTGKVQQKQLILIVFLPLTAAKKIFLDFHLTTQEPYNFRNRHTTVNLVVTCDDG